MLPRKFPMFMFWCVKPGINAITMNASGSPIVVGGYSFLAIRSNVAFSVTLRMGEWTQTYSVNPTTFSTGTTYRVYLSHDFQSYLDSVGTGAAFSYILNGTHTDFDGMDQGVGIPQDVDISGNVLTITITNPEEVTSINFYSMNSDEFPQGIQKLTALERLGWRATRRVESLPNYLYSINTITQFTLTNVALPGSLLSKTIPNEIINMPIIYLSWQFYDSVRNRDISNIGNLALMTNLDTFRFLVGGTAYDLGDWVASSSLRAVKYYLCEEHRDVSPSTNPIERFDPTLKLSNNLQEVNYDLQKFNHNVLVTFDSPHIQTILITDRGTSADNVPTTESFDTAMGFLAPLGVGSLTRLDIACSTTTDYSYASSYVSTYINKLYSSITVAAGNTDLTGVELRFIIDPKSTVPLEGTYQAPSDWDGTTGTPTSTLECLWLLANKYNIHVIYTTI